MNHNLRLTAEKITKRIQLIRPMIHRAASPLAPFRFEELEDATSEPGSGEDMGRVAWDSYWAGQNVHFVLRNTITVPRGFENPALFLPLGVSGDIFTHPEALMRIDGKPVASADRYHHLIPLDRDLADGAEHELSLQGWTGLSGWPPDPSNPARVQIRPAQVVDVDRDLQRFVIAAEVALETALERDPSDRLRSSILDVLDRAFVTLDTRDPMGDAFRASVAPAHEALSQGLKALGPAAPEKLHAIGHAHMDIAYLWPISQIRLKNARTYSNVLRLMDQSPAYRFSHSQPQLYAYTEEDYPEIFADIQERVAEGKWEVMGGMWVEPDCNVPGGEALVRQILLGRNYFQEKFGDVETPVLWLPDTFGFPHSLPQLMKLSGLKWFVTNKVNWNQYNQMPSSTTWWQGLDGSRVLAQFLTTPREVQHLPFPTNYKSDLTAREVGGTVTHATVGPDVKDFLICYGYGDGGGGPTEELILRAEAFADIPDMPSVEMSTVSAALKQIESQSTRLPVWNGELYLEGHRGTLTSQAWIKRANRLAERALHDAEAALVMGSPEGVSQEIRDRLKHAWKLVCLNQFHDILTGTSVPAVFVDARRDYQNVLAETDALLDAALWNLSGDEKDGATPGLLNPSPAVSSGIAFVPDTAALQIEGGQEVAGGALVPIQPMAPYATAPLKSSQPAQNVVVEEFGGGQIVLSNDLLRAEFDRNGDLVSLVHAKTGREALAPGEKGNVLWAYEDRPISWDAWDIDLFHDDRAEALTAPAEVELVERGPLRAALKLTRSYRDSKISQIVRLEAGSARLDFDTEVEWSEQHILLKVAFPVDVFSPRATYEIQWGEIERATHQNTSWEMAKFEVPGHKWADLSETGFGVALLNDCKYGYSVRDNVMKLTLIKSSTSPDPGADQGYHRFTYSVMPHEGDLREVRSEARRLNDPIILLPKGVVAETKPLVSCDAPNVILETLKPAEDGNGFILRLYESERRRGRIRLDFDRAFSKVAICNLLEEDVKPLCENATSAEIELSPFQILSLRFVT